MVTFEDCNRELISQGGQAMLQAWTASPEVKDYVTTFDHRQLTELSLEHVLDTKMRVETGGIDNLPLGNVQPNEAIREVEDKYPNYPMACVFYDFIEQRGRIPTFQEFRLYFTEERREWCYEDFRLLLQSLQSYTEEQKLHALRWRVGNAYSSSYREVYTLVSLREKFSIAVRYHLFADAQLQTDLWIDRNLICLRVPNKRYLGRKASPRDWAGDGFQVIEVNIEPQGFGKLWVPSEVQLRHIADAIQNWHPGTVSC